MTKTCTACRVVKEATSEFFHRNKNNPDGLVWECKSCANLKRSQRKKDARPSMYGITWGDYDRFLEEQGGRCAICLADQPSATREVWCIDHCHETGVVRGLLCHECNTGLGKFRDNIANLTRAQAYLEKVPKN